LGGPDVKPPVGAFPEGIPFPTLRQRRPRPGEKPSGVSAFVGVKGEDIRTLRARRPEASAVCRKAAGSRPHPATISHMGIHFQPLSAICGSTLSHMWFHMPAICSSTYPWTPWHSTSKGVAKGMVEGDGGRGWRPGQAIPMATLRLDVPYNLPRFPWDPTVYPLRSSSRHLGAAGMAWLGFGTTFSNTQQHVERRSTTC
jgi:hypothetical protein